MKHLLRWVLYISVTCCLLLIFGFFLTDISVTDNHISDYKDNVIMVPAARTSFLGFDLGKAEPSFEVLPSNEVGTYNMSVNYSYEYLSLFKKTESIEIYVDVLEIPVFHLTDGNTVICKIHNACPSPAVTVEDPTAVINFDMSRVNTEEEGTYDAECTYQNDDGYTSSIQFSVVITSQDTDVYYQKKMDFEQLFPSSFLSAHERISEDSFDDYWFIGDSIVSGIATSHYINLEHTISAACYAPSNFTVKNVEWASQQTTLNAIQNLTMYNADKIVIMFGLCDVGLYNVDQFVGMYSSAIRLIQEYLPESKIYVSTILPIEEDYAFGKSANQEIRMYNYYLAQLCNYLGIDMLDPAYSMTDDNGNGLSGIYLDDQIHLNDTGKEIIRNYFFTHLPE